LAGGLKRQLKAKYGIRPKVRHQYHELDVLVNGKSVFCHSRAQRIPTVESLLAAVEEAARSAPAAGELAPKS
jgi:hypothetical protein